MSEPQIWTDEDGVRWFAMRVAYPKLGAVAFDLDNVTDWHTVTQKDQPIVLEVQLFDRVTGQFGCARGCVDPVELDAFQRALVTS